MEIKQLEKERAMAVQEEAYPHHLKVQLDIDFCSSFSIV